MAATATAQVNARIDPVLKRRGDEGLAEAGLTPTEGVRALYELAARCAGRPESLLTALFPDAADEKARAAEAERARKLALVRKGATLIDDACAAYGLAAASPVAALSLDELRDLAYEEKYAEAMGWEQ